MYRTLTNFVRATNINNNSNRQISSLCASDAYFSFSCIRDSILCSPWPWGISRHSFLLVNKVYLSFHRRMDSKEPTLSSLPDSAMITSERSDDTAGIIGK